MVIKNELFAWKIKISKIQKRGKLANLNTKLATFLKKLNCCTFFKKLILNGMFFILLKIEKVKLV